MSEDRSPEPGRRPAGQLAAVAGVVLAGLALAVALFVVIGSSRRVVPERLPPSLVQPPPDTGFVIFRANIRRKLMSLSARCQSKRKQIGDRMTPAQDSMARACDSAIALTLVRVAALDTVGRANRKAAADSVLAEYARAKFSVRAFTRSGRLSDLIDEDSLDSEIRKLISE